MHIATWNLERPHGRQKSRIVALEQQLSDIDADLWILTESHQCISPGPDFHSLHCEPLKLSQRHKAGEVRCSIHSRYPISRSLNLTDPESSTAALIETPCGPLIVIATVIPYHAAGTR